jgi:hypothetical protein
MAGVDGIILGRIVACTMIPLFVIFVSLMPRQKRVKFTEILIIFVILLNDLQSRLYRTSVIFHKNTIKYQGKDSYPFFLFSLFFLLNRNLLSCCAQRWMDRKIHEALTMSMSTEPM